MSLLNVFRVSQLGASSRCSSPISRAVIVRLAPRQSRELLRLRLPLQSRLTSTKAGWKKATPEPGSEHAARKYSREPPPQSPSPILNFCAVVAQQDPLTSG